ncbi:MAG: class I SAM-dependent methyltransferase, partial [Deltaproteobacteria bacterium]|nr:class I SAM-dependent methyltransferase [Deltaproteobacteria bacterium]
MEETQRIYLPAAGHDWLLPLYDPFTKLLGIESVHRELLAQADIKPGQRILEIGCGTGNLTILAK